MSWDPSPLFLFSAAMIFVIKVKGGKERETNRQRKIGREIKRDRKRRPAR